MNNYDELKSRFEGLADINQAKSMEAYMKNMFSFYGIPAKLRQEQGKDFISNAKKEKRIDWAFLDECYDNQHREFHYFVCDYLLSMAKYVTYDDISRIDKYISRYQWWDTIDCFDKLIGDIGLVDSRVDDLMLEWSKHENFWYRRLAIDHQMDRKEKTNVPLLEKIILNNLNEKEFFINKAIGWSLRSYSKTDPVWVKSFIAKNKENMANLSIKEASKYLD